MSPRAFTGTFDGNGRSITNFKIPAGADAILGYLPLGSYDENAVFANISGDMTPQEACDRSSPRPASTAPIRFNPHEEGGGNRLICQADQLSDTNAYIRSNLGGRYLVGKDITFPDPAPGSGNFILIGTPVTPFRGAFSLGGKNITGLRVNASTASITDRPIFGAYTPSPERFIGYPAVNTEDICDALVGITPAAAPIPYNPHVSTNNRLICQADQLSDTNAYIRSNLGQRYLLGKDITLSGSFTPIGTITGLFDGGGHTISDLMISSGSVNVGFFGQIASGSVVKNLNFQDPSVSFTGTVAANIGVLAGDSSGRIENVNVTGNTARVSGNTMNPNSQSVGGLVGQQTNGTIISSMASGNVSNGGSEKDYMGGLVGRQNGGTIENSTASGDVSNGGSEKDSMGGLVGWQSNGGMTRNSIASGDVSQGGDGGDRMGGLFGRQTTGTIEDSIASGDVSDGGDANDNMGGLVGLQSFPSSIAQSSLSLGSVLDGGGQSGDQLGGLMGEAVVGIRTNLYWNTQTSGLAVGVRTGSCGSCFDRSTAALTQATSLTGLNTPTSATAGPWNFGTTSQYPGLTFTSGDQTCIVRPVLTSAASTSTTTNAEFAICPDAVDADSFHPMCRAKPTGCPN